MKIAMVNGSPKGGKNNSGILLELLRPLIAEGNEVSLYRVNHKALRPEQYGELVEADALVLAFPLYFDAVPSHLLRMMTELQREFEARAEHQARQSGAEHPEDRHLTVYALINNGFYEGKQCRIAADIVKNWCARCGIRFGMAVGHGAGEMLGSLGRVPLGHGPLKNLGRALDRLSAALLTGSSADSLFIQPNFPRIAWRLSATYGFWHPQAKKHGLKLKDIRKRPSLLRNAEDRGSEAHAVITRS